MTIRKVKRKRERRHKPQQQEDVRIHEESTNQVLSLKQIASLSVNRPAMHAFGIVSASIALLPLILFVIGRRFEFTPETWGVVSVAMINLTIGAYAYYVYLEEKSLGLT